MSEISGSFNEFLSTVTKLDPPPDELTINEMKHIVENSINGKTKSNATYTHFKTMYPNLLQHLKNNLMWFNSKNLTCHCTSKV